MGAPVYQPRFAPSYAAQPAYSPAPVYSSAPVYTVQPVVQSAVITEAPARMVVTLPADAKLTVDGRATTSTSSSRVFETPNLKKGLTFHYTLQATITRDGQKLSATKRVAVHAGETSKVAFDLSTATYTSAD